MIETLKRCICDSCEIAGPECLESESPTAVAFSVGWHCVKDEHLCPDCAASRKDIPRA